MANTEIEKTLKKIADTQLVHARLMETNERKWNKRFEAHEGRVENLERGAEHLLRATEKLRRVAESRERRLDRLFKTMEDFIKGLKREDGRR